MLAVTLKGILAHKVRVLLTALSIALGVAFVAGTLVLTDGLNGSFAQAFRSQYAGVDVAVRSEAAFTDSEAANQRRPLPADTLDGIRGAEGVAHAEGFVRGSATVVGPDGGVLGAGARSRDGMSAPADNRIGDVRYSTGRAPAAAGEVAVDAGTAESGSLAVGDRVRVLSQGPPEEFTVVGIARFGDADRLGATTTALFDLGTAQRVFGKVGQFDEIRVLGGEAVDPGELRDRLAGALPGDVEAVTGQAVVDEQTDLATQSLGFLNTFLLVFAAIAVFVGSFIIWNTFTILVAQRTRELALLRAIGATRRQVRRSVLGEALAVGVLASVLGIGLGLGVARLLVLLMTEVVGLDLPAPGGVGLRTVLVSLAVGTVVTVVASVAPARRATKVAPVEALREAPPGGFRFSRRRAAVGAVVLAAGSAVLAAGLFGGGGAALVGLGAAVTLLGVTVLLPLVARVLARVLGSPVAALGGMTGKLARDNAMRNPRRTASTAAALMIGLAMVAGVTILASSLQESIGGDIEGTVRADLVVQLVDGQGAGLSPQVAEAIRETPGVESVSQTSYGRAEIDGEPTYVTPVDPATVTDVLDLGVTSGTVAGLSDGILVHEDVAEAEGWQVGSSVPVSWPSTGDSPLRVAGIFAEKDVVGSDYLVSLEIYDRNATGRLDSLVLLTAEEGGDLAAVQDAVVADVAAFADAEVLTAQEFYDSISGQVDQFLLFVTALLLLAVFIALMGIVNTLALSVFERTREIGLLRAIGMTRRQVRSMVRWESVLIATIGAVAGAVVGIAFGVALVTALDGEGVSELAVPGVRLSVYVLAAAAAGVLAAVAPARRAAKVDVLRAVVSD